ncbi:hypothetical protein [Leptospira adleri]|uniref:hypothetical protein n=1 Tax=Leptospira adleri TaxID=2023186 RepID=UPI0010846C39|nr:hypothetical protein [Leptospira adleri]TGM58406.1 hypothetical protein EHQ97_08230 [Leptospira adleri]
MMKRSGLILISCLFAIFVANCSIMPIKTVSSKDVPLNAKYKMGNSAVQITNLVTRVFGIAVSADKDYGLLTSELQTKENCVFMKNVEFRSQNQAILFLEFLTSTVKAECWIKE